MFIEAKKKTIGQKISERVCQRLAGVKMEFSSRFFVAASQARAGSSAFFVDVKNVEKVEKKAADDGSFRAGSATCIFATIISFL